MKSSQLKTKLLYADRCNTE